MSISKDFEASKLYYSSYQLVVGHIESKYSNDFSFLTLLIDGVEFVTDLNGLRWIVNLAIQCGRSSEGKRLFKVSLN